MRDYAEQRTWSDQFLPEIQEIVGRHLLNAAPDALDQREATDLMMLTARDKRIAARVRRYGFAQRFPNQFTLRARLPSGTKTELAKVVEGKGDWMFYGHANLRETKIEHWWLLDLSMFRAALIRRHQRPILHGDIKLSDGTCFKWFDIRTFPNGLVIASSKSGGIEPI